MLPMEIDQPRIVGVKRPRESDDLQPPAKRPNLRLPDLPVMRMTGYKRAQRDWAVDGAPDAKRLCSVGAPPDSMDTDQDTAEDAVIAGIASVSVWFPPNFHVVTQK